MELLKGRDHREQMVYMGLTGIKGIKGKSYIRVGIGIDAGWDWGG